MDRIVPKFSIVIPTYNRANFLKKTLTSVLDQTYKNFEVIVVDDGSTDHTNEVMEEFTGVVQYFKKTNEERAAARNFGVQRAKGEFVTFIDSDDILKPHHFEEANKITLNNPEIDVFHLSYDIVDSNNKVIKEPLSYSGIINDKLIEGNFLSCIGTFVRAKVFEQFQFNEIRELSGSEDYEFWLRIASQLDIHYFDLNTASMIQHDDRSVVSTYPEKLIKRIDILKDSLFSHRPFLNVYKDHLKRFGSYLDIYIALHSLPNRMIASRFLIEAIRKYPAILLDRRFFAFLKNFITG